MGTQLSGVIDGALPSRCSAWQGLKLRTQPVQGHHPRIPGDVLLESDVQTAAGIVTSVITTRSVEDLELAVGSEVIAFVKSTEVSIAKLRATNHRHKKSSPRAAFFVQGSGS